MYAIVDTRERFARSLKPCHAKFGHWSVTERRASEHEAGTFLPYVTGTHQPTGSLESS